MKPAVFLFLMLFITGVQAQTSKTIVHNSLTRSYLECVPASYTGNEPLPLVICLHGLGDNMTNFSGIGLHVLGETENFITLYPQAQNSIIGTMWNAGVFYMGMTVNGGVQDVDFLNTLIDTTSSLYNIDSTRVYFCGFSMGGFMAQRMACQSSGRIAAVCSVAGTRANSIVCSPTNPVPVCHFHGTADQTIPYSANPYGIDADTLVDYWVNFNECDTIPTQESIPDIVNDSITVEHYIWTNTATNVNTEFYKATGADHQWLFTPNNDMDYTTAIWDFFKRYQLQSSTPTQTSYSKNVNSSPNPAGEYIEIKAIENDKGNIEIIDATGNVVCSAKKEMNVKTISTSQLKAGFYKIRFISDNPQKEAVVTKFIKQ